MKVYKAFVFAILFAFSCCLALTPIQASPSSIASNTEINSIANASFTTVLSEKTVEQVLNEFLKPVEFSRTGLSSFFKHCFQDPLYTERFLPACFVHLTDFLKYGVSNKKPRSFATSALTLFQQRLSACAWVNPYALLSFLDQTPELLAPYATSTSENQMVKVIKNRLQQELANHFDLLKRDPTVFLDQAAHKILTDVAEMNELQNRLAQLLVLAISKLVWNPKEKLDVWNLMTAIGTRLSMLYDLGLVSRDDLNLLTWTLINRFNYFIDCAGSQLSEDFYKKIQEEVVADKYPFITLTENEPELMSKKEFILQHLVLRGLGKSQAFSMGFLSDQLMNPKH